MKRLFTSLLCAFMVIFAPFHVSAEENGKFETAGDLYEYWTRKSGLPSYISGVWSTDEGVIDLTFGVTNDEAGREGARQILEWIADDSTVTIVYQTYALKYLYDIQAEIERYLEEDIGFRAVGVYFETNRVEVDVSQKRLQDPKTNAVIHALVEQYGNAVYFKFSNGQYRFATDSVDSPAGDAFGLQLNPAIKQPNSQRYLLYAMLAVVAVCVVALCFSEYKRRKLLALLSVSGIDTKPHRRITGSHIHLLER